MSIITKTSYLSHDKTDHKKYHHIIKVKTTKRLHAVKCSEKINTDTCLIIINIIRYIGTSNIYQKLSIYIPLYHTT